MQPYVLLCIALSRIYWKRCRPRCEQNKYEQGWPGYDRVVVDLHGKSVFLSHMHVSVCIIRLSVRIMCIEKWKKNFFRDTCLGDLDGSIKCSACDRKDELVLYSSKADYSRGFNLFLDLWLLLARGRQGQLSRKFLPMRTQHSTALKKYKLKASRRTSRSTGCTFYTHVT